MVNLANGYMRVFYNEENIGIEYYDKNFNIQSRKNINMELPMWGGFYAGNNLYYCIVFWIDHYSFYSDKTHGLSADVGNEHV